MNDSRQATLSPASLDDAQMTRFLRDGFVVLSAPELGRGFHAAMFDNACQVHDEARAIGGDSNHLQVMGDNLRARIPCLDELLYSDTVQGALTSVLGPDFVLHPHHFVHEASTDDQSFHQDGNLPWNERAHYRSHVPNWAMLFYYPQAVTLESGPTEVLPGTQYWTTDFERTTAVGIAAMPSTRRCARANSPPTIWPREIVVFKRSWIYLALTASGAARSWCLPAVWSLRITT